MSKRLAAAWGVLFPWIVALPLLYQPNALNQFITFSSLVFVSFTDFIIPWSLYISLLKVSVCICHCYSVQCVCECVYVRQRV